MNLPWVSRLAYTEVCRQRDRLEAKNDELLDSLTRLVRVDRGLTEKKAEARPPVVVPDKIKRIVGQFSNSNVQADIRARVVNMHRENTSAGMDEKQSWLTIERFLIDGIGEA